ncbi:MAG: hypothetical protein R2881_05645 [Eubacteriales bacterium]
MSFHPAIANDIVHWSRRDSAQKQQVLCFIQTLVFCGYTPSHSGNRAAV